jgi:two-component system sensor histidine kinase PhcS
VAAIATDIDEGVNRVGSIVSDLRSFAHPEIRAVQPVDVSLAVGRALRLLGKEIANREVQVHTDVPAYTIALGDENQISQVVLNLVQNSLHALDGRPEPEIGIRTGCENGRIAVWVRDNGAGIAPGNLQRIFDPFFTTKDVGQGMGLGLSLCYRIMHQMGGDIEVRSDLGVFTEFKLSFRPGLPSA